MIEPTRKAMAQIVPSEIGHSGTVLTENVECDWFRH